MTKIPHALRNFLLGYFILHLVAAGVFVWFLTGIVRNQMLKDARLRMVAMAQILAEHIADLDLELQDPQLPDHLQNLGNKTDYRFTIIQADGTVVCDSETGLKDIGPHGDRPEVIAAQKHPHGFSERFSRTLQMPMFYLALVYESPSNGERQHDGQNDGFVRVAAPAGSIKDAIQALQASVWFFAVVISFLTVTIMVVFATRAMQPLSLFANAAKEIGTGQYDSAPTLLGRTDEWGQLAEAFKQMQAELGARELGMRENSARLEAVLRSMIEGVIAVSSDDSVMLANAAACRMLSLSREELIGRKLLEVVRIPELSDAVAVTRERQELSKSEFQTPPPNRKVISARVSVLESDTDDKGETPGIALVLHDITELRQLESMRRNFVANVSHELKTPLSSILAYAETLNSGLYDEQKNLQFVEQIEAQASLLNRQIQDLLQLARVESGQEVWDFGAVSINNICRQSVRQFSSEASQQGVELELQSPGEELMARADADGLMTIVNNLVSNAIHYTPRGGKIRIVTSREKGSLQITIADTGIGIAPKHHARVFEWFYRVDKARSREKGGPVWGWQSSSISSSRSQDRWNSKANWVPGLLSVSSCRFTKTESSSRRMDVFRFRVTLGFTRCSGMLHEPDHRTVKED